MAGSPHFFDLARFVSATGTADGGTVTFYYTGTTNLAPIYADAALTTPLANPVLVAVGQIVPNIFLDNNITYRRRIVFTSDGSVLDKDPVPAGYARLSDLTATTGAALVKTSDGTSVQAKLDSLSASITSNVAINASSGILNSNPSALPYQVSTISGGVGTGTGGTNGTYVGGVSGGPAGFAWIYTIAGGALATYQIVNGGLSTSSTAPTLSLPYGSLTSPTVPTATTAVIPVNKTFFASTADSLGLGLWQNVAGTLTTVKNPDTTQIIFYNKAASDAVAAAAAASATAAATSASAAAGTAVKPNLRYAAGKSGKGSFLQRSTLLPGFRYNDSGVLTASTNAVTSGLLPCTDTQGVASSIGSFGGSVSQIFFDSSNNPIARNLSLSTATFVNGSANFTVTAWRGGNPGLVPPSAPGGITVFSTTDPLMLGMPLYDQTNGNNSIIPLGAYVTAVQATPFATGVYTMSSPAASSGSINVWTGGCLPGVPILPPAAYNITQTAIFVTYAGSFGIQNSVDDLDFFPANFAIAAEQKAYTGSSTELYQRSGHDVGVGWADVEASRPLLGRNIGVLGNSALGHEGWSKTLALLTRGKIAMRGAVAGRQAHQFLDGVATTATGGANWNGINPSNANGVAVAADFNGLEVVLIGTCGPNEQGYNTGSSTIGNAPDGSNRMPYSIGSITESGCAVVATVTTTNASNSISVSAILQQSALLPTLVGLKFPTTAPNGLAGRTIASQSTGSTGGTGTYLLDSGSGVTAGTASMMIGSYYGTMNWLLGKLLAFNTTNSGKMLPVIVSPIPRYDMGSSNGGVTTGTYDLTNPGNPQNVNGVRLNQFVDANIALAQLWKIPIVDLFYNGGFSPFWESKYYNSDHIHAFDAVPLPIGDRAVAHQIAAVLNRTVPIA